MAIQYGKSLPFWFWPLYRAAWYMSQLTPAIQLMLLLVALVLTMTKPITALLLVLICWQLGHIKWPSFTSYKP